jgi:hypothetical protein
VTSLGIVRNADAGVLNWLTFAVDGWGAAITSTMYPFLGWYKAPRLDSSVGTVPVFSIEKVRETLDALCCGHVDVVEERRVQPKNMIPSSNPTNYVNNEMGRRSRSSSILLPFGTC